MSRKTDIIYSAYKSGYNFIDLAKNVGMIIPPHLNKKESEQYFVDNIFKYESVLNRDPTKLKVRKPNNIISNYYKNQEQILSELKKFTDGELMGIFGYYVVYNNRDELIENLISVLYGVKYYVKFSENRPEMHNLIIRYGNINMGSTIFDTDKLEAFDNLLENQSINNMKQLLKLLESYKLQNKSVNAAIEKVSMLIEKKKNWQISLWPMSKTFL